MQEVLDIRTMLTNTADLRAPIHLEEQLRSDEDMDSEVGLSMMQMLKV